jgi:hypothetical protein
MNEGKFIVVSDHSGTSTAEVHETREAAMDVLRTTIEHFKTCKVKVLELESNLFMKTVGYGKSNENGLKYITVVSDGMPSKGQ